MNAMPNGNQKEGYSVIKMSEGGRLRRIGPARSGRREIPK